MTPPFDLPFPEEDLIPEWAKPPVVVHRNGYSFVAYRAPRDREIFWDFLRQKVWMAGPIQGLRREHKRVILCYHGNPHMKEPSNVIQFPPPSPHGPRPGLRPAPEKPPA